jgi:hypothetical protein
MLMYQFRPIDQWPGTKTSASARKGSQFKAPWSKTLDLLERELNYLKAKDIVIQAAVQPHEIRNDGMLRSGARPSWPGVILSFNSKHGELSYPCDTYTDWQANIRAIALALEALRAVDRYGVTRRAEQYKGWARLEGPKRVEGDVEDAALLLAKYHIVPFRDILNRRETAEVAYRVAASKTHPDGGGTPDAFKAVQRAKEILDQHFGSAA